MPSPDWSPAPQTLTLAADSVHIWQASRHWPTDQLKQWHGLLTRDERERANRFRFAKDRTYYIAGRAILRLILSRYLTIPPHQLQFEYNNFGKPGLPGTKFNFNLSHADGLALYAVTRQREIGIDVEKVRGDIDYSAIAARYFSEQETAVLHDLPSAQQAAAFYNGWTRKEAYIKAQGLGLTLPLNSFSVSLSTGQPVTLQLHNTSNNANWTIHPLPLDRGYVGAVAVQGTGLTFQFLQWV